MIQESKDFIKKVEQLNKMTNGKPPEEIIFQINEEAQDFSLVPGDDQNPEWYNDYQKEGYIAGATAWAPWKVKCDELQATIDDKIDKVLHAERNKMQAKISESETEWAKKCHTLATVLQEFVSKHEAGLLPDRFVYEKAIKILNDGK